MDITCLLEACKQAVWWSGRVDISKIDWAQDTLSRRQGHRKTCKLQQKKAFVEWLLQVTGKSGKGTHDDRRN